MSTASLYALLETEMDEKRDNIDVEKIDSILAVLNERTPEEPVDVDAAWDSFIHNYYTGEPLYPEQEDTSAGSPDSTTQSEIQTKNQSSEKSSRKKRPVRILLIAAVVVVALGAITVSATNVWDAVLSWTSETFGLAFGISDIPSTVESPELAELAQALIDDDVYTPLLPKYLPNGYTQSELYIEDCNYMGVYQNNNQEILIWIREINRDAGIQYEQDTREPENYMAGGIQHVISTNLGEYTAIWENSGYECSIMHVPSKQELIAMIDSIYTEDMQ